MTNTPPTERFVVFIPTETGTEIRVEAARQRTTISAIATEALQQYLQTRKEAACP